MPLTLNIRELAACQFRGSNNSTGKMDRQSANRYNRWRGARRNHHVGGACLPQGFTGTGL